MPDDERKRKLEALQKALEEARRVEKELDRENVAEDNERASRAAQRVDEQPPE